MTHPHYQILGVTGNRPHLFPKPCIPLVKAHLDQLMARFKTYGGKCVHYGGARGVDLWAASAARKHDMQIVLHRPYEGQTDGWNDEEKTVYEQLEHTAIAVHTTCPEVAPTYLNMVAAFHARNRAIVHAVDILVAVRMEHNRRGGTWSTRQYALKHHIPLLDVLITPDGTIREAFHQPKTTQDKPSPPRLV